jgi:hypothetical protein
MNTDPMRRPEFLRALALKSGLPNATVKKVWSAVEAVFAESIKHKREINLRNFGRLFFEVIPERDGFRGADFMWFKRRVGEEEAEKHRTEFIQHFPAAYKVRFVIARDLRHIIKGDGDREEGT